MSEETTDLTRRAHDAFNSDDVEAFVALMDEDVEALPRIVGTLGSGVRGHADIRRWRRDLLDLFPDLRVEALELRDLGDATLVRSRYHGHGATSGTPFDSVNWLVWRWRDGKCVKWVSKPTEAEALEAVGRPE